jgi:lipopolysaccharide export system protein LptA
MKRALWLLASLLLAFAPPPAEAQLADLSGTGPIAVTARDGFTWNEQAQTVTALGEARAVRGTVTVLADRLIAFYRKKPGAASKPAPPPAGGTAESPTGGNEIYRLEAVGHVRILTPTEEAVGDQAVYDIDQSVLVMTGKALRLTTPQYVLTARDSLEYWTARHMAVGRGHAVVVATDGRRLSADVLVGFFTPSAAPAVTPAAAAAPPVAAGTAASRLEKVEAFGNVEVRTQGDVVRGDRGVYVPETGVARVLGHVQVLHGQNLITGAAAIVNVRTGIAHVTADPGTRVEGVVMPNETPKAPPSPPRGSR